MKNKVDSVEDKKFNLMISKGKANQFLLSSFERLSENLETLQFLPVTHNFDVSNDWKIIPQNEYNTHTHTSIWNLLTNRALSNTVLLYLLRLGNLVLFMHYITLN